MVLRQIRAWEPFSTMAPQLQHVNDHELTEQAQGSLYATLIYFKQ